MVATTLTLRGISTDNLFLKEPVVAATSTLHIRENMENGIKKEKKIEGPTRREGIIEYQ